MSTDSPSLSETIAALVGKVGAKPALIHAGKILTFAGLHERVQRLAAGLVELGVRPGDRIGLWLPNVPAWVEAMLAAAHIGAIAVALNTRFRERELADILSRARVKVLLCWPTYRGIDFESILDQVLPGLPQLQHVVVYAEAGDAEFNPTWSAIQVHSFDSLLAGSHVTVQPSGRGSDPCLVFTTSGTTKSPKLVVHSQIALIRHARDVAPAFGFAPPAPPVLVVLPLCGTYGLTQALAGLLNGNAVLLHHTFDPALAVDTIRQHGIRGVGMTEEMVRRLYDQVPVSQPLHRITFFTGTRAATLLPLGRQRGFSIVNIYGSSELQTLFSRRGDADLDIKRTTAGGRPVSEAARVRVRDPVSGELAGYGREGELEVLAPRSGMLGYLDDAEATRAAFTSDGYFRTGDTGVTFDDGTFDFVCRTGDTMRLAGFLVNPVEIESCVEEVASVRRCHVAAAEAKGRSVVVAFWLAAGQPRASEQELRAHCARRMAPYKVPMRFVQVRGFPEIGGANTSKLSRNALCDWAQAVVSGGTSSSLDAERV